MNTLTNPIETKQEYNLLLFKQISKNKTANICHQGIGRAGIQFCLQKFLLKHWREKNEQQYWVLCEAPNEFDLRFWA